MVTQTAKIDIAKTQAWSRGFLRWKLRPHQQGVYDQIKQTKGGSFYFNKARRIGGSYLLCVLAVEKCLQKSGAQVKYAAPTGKAVRKIITPNIRKILRDCPKELKPKFSLIQGQWQFPNGSILSVAGCDNQQYQNLRGTESDFVCLDQVGFIDDLDYILNDVLMPQVQDTQGVIVLTSTPPRSPAHQSFKIHAAHKASGRYAHVSVWDNKHRSVQQHTNFFRQMAQSKGMSLQEFYESTTFRRQYLGQFVADEQRSVIPQWNLAVQKHVTNLSNKPVPQYRDRYVSLDIGWRDGMGVLFAYWDYKRAILVIQDQLLLFKKTAQQTAYAIKTKELQLWGADKPFLRISDNNLQTISDINSHGLTFIPTRKDDKQLQVNNLREWVRGYKIWIKPKCRRLLSQLGSTVWNKQRTSYERNSEGHGDLLDALVYLVRNVRRDRNPYPGNYGMPTGFDWVLPDQSSTSSTTKFQKLMLDHFGVQNEE